MIIIIKKKTNPSPHSLSIYGRVLELRSACARTESVSPHSPLSPSTHARTYARIYLTYTYARAHTQYKYTLLCLCVLIRKPTCRENLLSSTARRSSSRLLATFSLTYETLINNNNFVAESAARAYTGRFVRCPTTVTLYAGNGARPPYHQA